MVKVSLIPPKDRTLNYLKTSNKVILHLKVHPACQHSNTMSEKQKPLGTHSLFSINWGIQLLYLSHKGQLPLLCGSGPLIVKNIQDGLIWVAEIVCFENLRVISSSTGGHRYITLCSVQRHLALGCESQCSHNQKDQWLTNHKWTVINNINNSRTKTVLQL